MILNNSPWIQELNQARKNDTLTENTNSDIVIVGAGIAGVTTAFFTLKYTKQKVLLVEGSKIAHGASGHNGGQAVAYFEKPYDEIVEEYGLEMAAAGQKALYKAWDLLDEIYKEAELKTPFAKFLGQAGCSTVNQLNQHLKNKYLRFKAGLSENKALVSKQADIVDQIPSLYKDLYEVVDQSYINDLLEVKTSKYIAVLQATKGCLNSALFCEELIGYLLIKYPTRFRLVEHTPIHSVILNKSWGMLLSKEYYITAKKIILCTNGFEKLSIYNTLGEDINSHFHELVEGVVGYMSAYVETSNRKPTAISYLEKTVSYGTEDYFYLTRRKYELNKKSDENLICLGGPVATIDSKLEYNNEESYPDNIQKKLNKFLIHTYNSQNTSIDYKYNWHGLMGYTKTGLRCIGEEPLNKVLLYNLGCNGVGILPSIYGSRKISRILNKEKLNPSIFDPLIYKSTHYKKSDISKR